VTILLFDGLIALVKSLDRGMTAVEQSVRRRFPPRTVDDAQKPAGAGTPPSAAGTGGHPIRSTSELLTQAHDVIVDIFELDKNGGYGPCFLLVRELRDRAAQFKAVGD
jgi:hypothetical protein